MKSLSLPLSFFHSLYLMFCLFDHFLLSRLFSLCNCLSISLEMVSLPLFFSLSLSHFLFFQPLPLFYIRFFMYLYLCTPFVFHRISLFISLSFTLPFPYLLSLSALPSFSFFFFFYLYIYVPPTHPLVPSTYSVCPHFFHSLSISSPVCLTTSSPSVSLPISLSFEFRCLSF